MPTDRQAFVTLCLIVAAFTLVFAYIVAPVLTWSADREIARLQTFGCPLGTIAVDLYRSRPADRQTGQNATVYCLQRAHDQTFRPSREGGKINITPERTGP